MTKAVPLVSLRSPNRIWYTAPYLPNMPYSSSAEILNGRFRTYNIRFTSGGSRDCANDVEGVGMGMGMGIIKAVEMSEEKSEPNGTVCARKLKSSCLKNKSSCPRGLDSTRLLSQNHQQSNTHHKTYACGFSGRNVGHGSRSRCVVKGPSGTPSSLLWQVAGRRRVVVSWSWRRTRRVAGSDLDFLSALVQRKTDALKILMPAILQSAVRRSSSVSYPCVLVTLLSSVVRV